MCMRMRIKVALKNRITFKVYLLFKGFFVVGCASMVITAEVTTLKSGKGILKSSGRG